MAVSFDEKLNEFDVLFYFVIKKNEKMRNLEFYPFLDDVAVIKCTFDLMFFYFVKGAEKLGHLEVVDDSIVKDGSRVS